MNIKSLKVGFYIRGETPRTLSQQYLSLQKFSLDYQIPIGDVIIVMDIARSNEPRPGLESVLTGELPLDLLAMHSSHILHMFEGEFEELSLRLTNRGIVILNVNVPEETII